jgi:hypothetical protein
MIRVWVTPVFGSVETYTTQPHCSVRSYDMPLIYFTRVTIRRRFGDESVTSRFRQVARLGDVASARDQVEPLAF